MLSIREISERVGVSIATVSRALDPRFSGKVRASTRSKILSLCDKHNFRPSVTGRSFVTGKTFKIGLIFGGITVDLGNPLGGLFMRGVCSELQPRNYAPVILHATESRGLEESTGDFLRSNVADAYIIGSSMITERVCDAISRCGRPVVATDSGQFDTTQISIIGRDSVPAYREAWGRVPEAWRDSTAFVAHASSTSQNKLEIICAAAPNAEKPLYIPLDFPFAEFCFDRHLARVAAEKRLKELSSYRLLWCGSDLTALGVADALRSAGIIPGRDIFLVGHDNIEGITTFCGTPYLSTIDVHWEEEGRLAAKIALDQIEENNPKHVKLPSTYIPRQSFPDPLPK